MFPQSQRPRVGDRGVSDKPSEQQLPTLPASSLRSSVVGDMGMLPRNGQVGSGNLAHDCCSRTCYAALTA